MGLSRREYAKRRGCTDKAVRKALVSRIAAALLPDDTIDADLADSLWEGNTRVSQRRGKEADRAPASMAAAADPEPAIEVRAPADQSALGSAPITRPAAARGIRSRSTTTRIAGSCGSTATR